MKVKKAQVVSLIAGNSCHQALERNVMFTNILARQNTF